MAGIMVNTSGFENNTPGYVLAMPDEVWINTGGAPRLQKSNLPVNRWTE